MGANTLTLTEAGSAAAAGAIVGATFGFLMFLMIGYWILTIVASWKIFKKAGEPGWKAFIPIYNIYTMYKIVGMSNWLWGMLCASLTLSIVMAIDGTSNLFSMTDTQLAAFNWGMHPLTIIALVVCAIFDLVVSILYSLRTSKAFGHGVGFAVGLFLLQPIFWLILGFGSSKYNKKVALAK